MLRTTSTIIQRTAETVHFHSNPPSSCQSRLTGIQQNGTHSIPGTVVRVDNDDRAIYPATFPPLLPLEHQFCVWEKSGAHRFVHGVTWSGSSWYSIYTLWTGISVPEDMKSQRRR